MKIFFRNMLPSSSGITFLSPRTPRAGLRLVSARGSLLIWRLFKPIFFNIFRFRAGLKKIWVRVPKLWIILGKILSRVETWVYKQQISDYQIDVLAPLIGLRTEQVPGWPVPCSMPESNTWRENSGRYDVTIIHKPKQSALWIFLSFAA